MIGSAIPEKIWRPKEFQLANSTLGNFISAVDLGESLVERQGKLDLGISSIFLKMNSTEPYTTIVGLFDSNRLQVASQGSSLTGSEQIYDQYAILISQ